EVGIGSASAIVPASRASEVPPSGAGAPAAPVVAPAAPVVPAAPVPALPVAPACAAPAAPVVPVAPACAAPAAPVLPTLPAAPVAEESGVCSDVWEQEVSTRKKAARIRAWGIETSRL